MTDETVLLVCSDLHLSHRPPPFRAREPSWYDAMGRVLGQVRTLATEMDLCVVIAGDVFDKWNSPPELANWAIDQFREFPRSVFTIPGQHDLPEHNYEHMHRSAYGTLVRSGAVTDLGRGTTVFDGMRLHAFPWGRELVPLPEAYNDGELQVAIIHHYVWAKGHGYPGADEDDRIGVLKKQLAGYDSCFFGDNHKGFYFPKRPSQMNCGGMMRRKRDEIDYDPQVGLLLRSGGIKRVRLDTSDDVYSRAGEDVLGDQDESFELAEEFDEYIHGIQKMTGDDLDFCNVIRQIMNERRVVEAVRRGVEETINEDGS